MDVNVKGCVGDIRTGGHAKPLPCVDLPGGILNGRREDDDETASLLSPQRSGLSRNPEKPPRKVQWNDSNGNSLVEVLEYQPSVDSESDSESESESESEPCLCTIM